MTNRYVDVEGIPGVYDDSFIELPKTYFKGKWITHYKVDHFMGNASPISKERFDEMVARQETEGGQS